MIKVDAYTKIIVQKEERIHVFDCANGSNLGEIFDVLTEMRSYILKRMQDATKDQQCDQKCNEKVESIS